MSWVRCLGAILLCWGLLGACHDDVLTGDSQVARDHQTGDLPEGEQGCSSSLDCPEDMYCYGPAACGSVWTCQEEYPGCSAAAPRLACLCDGTIGTVAAGCPGRHHYVIPDLIHEGFMGSPCDPAHPEDFEDVPPATLEVIGLGFEAYNGMDVWGRPSQLHSSDPDFAPKGPVRIEGGTFSFSWPNFLDLYDYYHTMHVFIDLDGDGRCSDTENEVAWDITVYGPNSIYEHTASATLNLAETPAAHVCEAWPEP